MVDYAKLSTVAETLIEENGRTITLIKRSRTVSDATKPWRGVSATNAVELSLKGVFDNYKEQDIDGDLIRRGDQMLLIAHNDVSSNEIETFDEVTDGTDTWKIISVKLIKPGNTRIYYELGLRK